MSLRASVKAAFEEADTEKKGAISVEQLCALMKKLTPDLSKADEDLMVSKLAVDQGGMVQIDNFIDVFCGSPPGLRRELSKPIKPEELEVIKEAFKKFDKDGSGKIDVKELAAMCTELGKKMSEQQAMEAIKQLDRNGDSSVDFDEFVLWWTCSPGLGGYSHVALNFMKTKLALKSRAKIALTKIKRVKAAENEFAYNCSFDLTPNYLDAGKGSEEKSSVSFALRKVRDAREDVIDAGVAAITMRLKGKSPDAAATVIAAYEKFSACLTEEDSASTTGFPKVTQEKEFVSFKWSLPAPDGSPLSEFLEMVPMLEQTMKKFDAKVSLGTNFEQIVERPLAPLPRHFNGFKFSADVLACLDSIAPMLGDAPPPVQAAIKLMAGVTKDVKIGFDETSPMLLASRFKDMTRSEAEYFEPGQKVMWECADKGIETFRRGLHTLACTRTSDGGIDAIRDGAWNTSGGDPSVTIAACDFFMEVNRSLCGIETVTVHDVPGSTVEAVATFDRFNPFILGEYLFGSYPKAPEEPNKEALSKPMKDDEATKLQEIFKKFDKDGSGSIETKELKQIVVELGGTITDEEVEEAMAELDVNGDGSCCFEEFKAFWTTKSGLGGHSSTMLKFLKMKMAAGSMASKGRALLSNAGGFVTLKEMADTVLNYTCEMTPGMAECAEKMSVEAHFEVEDVKATGPPRVMLVIAAKSEAAAADCLAKINEAFEIVREPAEMSLPALPQFTQDGANIIFSFSPPEEMVSAAIYEQADMMKMITPAIKAVKNSRFQLSFANSFDDFLGSPDMPAPELFAGAKLKSTLSASAVGKGLFLNTMMSMMNKESALPELKIGMEMFKMFTGGDITACGGWHKAAVGGLMSMVEEMGLPSAVFCPSGARDFLPNLGPDSEMLPDEPKMLGKILIQVANQLESVQSVSIENVFLPKEFSQNGLDATIAIKATFENVKPFALANYILGPSLVKAGLSE